MDKNKAILGIDIGGSKIIIVLWNRKKVLKSRQVQPATLTNLKKGLEFFSRLQGSANLRVGVAVAGLVDEKSGRILKCPNLPAFNGLDLKKEVGKRTKVYNDAKCFLKAEMKIGSGKGYTNVLGVVFGTGIGGAINKYEGENSWAGEFGHMVIDKGKSWERLYQDTKNKPKEQEKINAIGLANLINVFNPEVIILAGKGAKAPNKRLISKYLLLPKKQMPKIVFSKLGDNAVAIGGAMLWEN